MQTITIGSVILDRTAALAPMAGVADRAFRELCRSYGAAYTVGEMVSAKGLCQGSQKSAQLLEIGPGERPCGVQLFGNVPEDLARAAVLALESGPETLDLNMGCPAPKIASGGGGAALMRQPELARDIIRAVKAVSTVPVTVKFRKGWDDQSINYLEFAQMAQEAGADAITLHGRTRAQMYAPSADWDSIRRVKEAVTVPVIGNGDVTTPEEAKALYDQTGCDLIMVGRGALGRPWLFEQIRDYLATGSYRPDPTLAERMAVMRRQVVLAASYKGEGVALREARKHCGWYMTGIRGAAQLRRQAGTISTLGDLDRLAEDAIRLGRE